MIATVDGVRLRQRAVPDRLDGMLPQDVLVGLRGGEPVLWDLDPVPVPVTWAELAEALADLQRRVLALAEAEEAAATALQKELR